MSEKLTPWWVAEGLGKYAMTDELLYLRAENERAHNYAENFLRSFVLQHFPPNPDWRPLPDLLGVLTQIDNATTITRDLRAENERLRAALKEAIDCVEFWADYASPYFKDRHGLEDNLIKLRAALKDAPQ